MQAPVLLLSLLAIFQASGQRAADDPLTLDATRPICLTNACDNAAPPAPSQPALNPRQIIGANPVPAGEPFAQRFDGNAPVLVRGRLLEARWAAGMAAEFVIAGDDGKRYRAIGGDAARFTPEARAGFEVGAQVTVRGYAAYDQSCLGGGCAVNARDLTFADGTRVNAAPPRAD